MTQAYMPQAKSDHWPTPDRVYDEALSHGWNLKDAFDPCPLHADFNGLTIMWKDVNYVNPPYDENYTQHYTDLREHQPRTKPKYTAYAFVKECARVLKPGGYLIILHWLVYKSCYGLKFDQIIPVHNGPNHRIRVATVLRKPGHLPTLYSFTQPLIRDVTQ